MSPLNRRMSMMIRFILILIIFQISAFVDGFLLNFAGKVFKLNQHQKNNLNVIEGFTAHQSTSIPQSQPNQAISTFSNVYKLGNALLFGMFTFSSRKSNAIAVDNPVITRADVGPIDLNVTEPLITDVCWMDIKVDDAEPQRVEISLYGTITPNTAANFKSLCKNEGGYGYKGSEIFRIISTFSVQGGNIGQPKDTAASMLGRYGKSSIINEGNGFLPENYRILHSYKDAGVISMMKDITKKGSQDSRFFITTSPYASWADEKYVAFGRVTKGMNLVSALQVIPVQPPSNYPMTKVEIIDSGCY